MRDDRTVVFPDLDSAPSVTMLQLTDTHLSALQGVPASLRWLLGEIAADPPDLVALTGDIVFEDPDDVDDRRFAWSVFAGLPRPLLTIPGNHDVGFYGDDDARPIGSPHSSRRGEAIASRSTSPAGASSG